MFKGDDIDRWVVFENAGWICFVCHQPVDQNIRLPNLMAPTLEHIIPLSEGGEHTWENTTLSHAKCNFSRGKSSCYN